ncbi:hypothetical protein [Paenibacillus macquariensis]|uniref:PH domain-containing protein n=1 Tax=Paenibacillus macquariensis TaxID=948756 RepID=A0ABY1JM81_9BACL|nr:hypothetical protein [Paenibacillus macquariensis]MEC0090621.1 hypothetical protein [Paenibacillus macquariensis]OAB25039.1 hypothetical protein PMSM_28835 [Paenibacillus macquariensis subsp. macquariensis]SIQ45136.1 hypothetical protein SAMN05421578_10250 [Paenibacillus macquariensis]
MNKKYEIKLPKSGYIQVISTILITFLLLLVLRKDDFLSVFFAIILFLCILLQVVMLLKKILRKSNELEITENTIKINHIEVPIEKIEKIIIQGYFVQSIGIKLYGRKFISMDLHFRFNNNEDVNIEELKQWASINRIKVTSGKIYRWI